MLLGQHHKGRVHMGCTLAQGLLQLVAIYTAPDVRKSNKLGPKRLSPEIMQHCLMPLRKSRGQASVLQAAAHSFGMI